MQKVFTDDRQKAWALIAAANGILFGLEDAEELQSDLTDIQNRLADWINKEPDYEG